MEYFNLFGCEHINYNFNKTECVKENGMFKIGGEKVVSKIFLENVALENIKFVSFIANNIILCKIPKETLQLLALIQPYYGQNIELDLKYIFGNMHFSNTNIKVEGDFLENIVVKKVEENYEAIVKNNMINISLPLSYVINCKNALAFNLRLEMGSISEMYFYCIPEEEDVKINSITMILNNYVRFHHTGDFLQNATFACSQKVNTNPNLYYYSFGNFCSLNLSRIDSTILKINMEKEFTGKILIFSRVLNICNKNTQQIGYIGIPTYLSFDKIFENPKLSYLGTFLFADLSENFCPISHEAFNIGEEIVQCKLCKKNYNEEYFSKYRKHTLQNSAILKCPYCRTSEIFYKYKLV